MASNKNLETLKQVKPKSVRATICPYCGEKSVKTTGAKIYPHRKDLKHLTLYHCAPCDAYVGTHKGSVKPLGRLANKELRAAKSAAHRAFDEIWKQRHLSRSAAYATLAKYVSLTPKNCHIGMFDIEQCYQVVAFANGYLFGEEK